jgi:hypothetical protein
MFLINIILVQTYSSHIIFSSFVKFEELSKSSSKLFKSPQNLQYCHQIWCKHFVKILKCQKLYCATTIYEIIMYLCFEIANTFFQIETIKHMQTHVIEMDLA